ncbi:MAG: Xylanase [Verrucomicrobiales bacterium]|nr:Xylanase [Verrucomicrobiales bacterium]
MANETDNGKATTTILRIISSTLTINPTLPRPICCLPKATHARLNTLMHPRNSFLHAFCLCLIATFPVFAAPQSPIPLWPATPPGEKEPAGEEKDTTKPTDNLVSGKPVIRLGNVSKPTLTFYPAPLEKNTGATVLVFPGGGYNILAMDLEGTEICEWFNSIGANAVLVKYRVPARKDQDKWLSPLQDGQRAISYVRERAADWKIDPNRIGTLGFSAGGHLSALTSTRSEQRAYQPMDDTDKLSCRPDFTILIYPAYLVAKGTLNVSPELTISKSTPPTFIAQTQDDPVGVEGSLGYYAALTKAKIPSSIHLYPKGGHGYGLRPSTNNVSHWPRELEEWMREAKLLQKK